MGSNVRFVWNNVGDDTSSLSATSEAGSLVAANMQADDRAAVWRSTGLAAQTLDFRWASAQSVDSICLAWTNLTAAATVQAKGYTNVGDPAAVFDQTVAPDTALNIGNVTAQNWIAAASNIKQLKIVITDAANPDGYVEVSRACIGKRVEPAYNWTSKTLNIGWIEQAKPKRAESFDLRTEPKGRCRRMRFALDWLEPTSRDAFVAMLALGVGRGVWVSAFPESSDAATRQLHAFWGARVSETDLGYPVLNTWAAPAVFEEMG